MGIEKASAIRDQAWASIRPYADDIERIIVSGPTRDGDINIIRKALHLVSGDLHFKKAEIKHSSGD